MESDPPPLSELEQLIGQVRVRIQDLGTQVLCVDRKSGKVRRPYVEREMTIPLFKEPR